MPIMTTPALRTHISRRGDHELHFHIASEGGRAVYLLIHGIGMSSLYWRFVARYLALHGTVVIVDLPGFGTSPEPRDSMSMQELGGFLMDGMREQGFDNVIVVGHSMGAQLAVECAIAAPENVNASLLISPCVFPKDRTLVKVAGRLALDSLVSDPRALWFSSVQVAYCGPLWYLEKLRTLMAYPIEERMPLMPGPVLAVSGRRDPICPEAWMDEVRESIPDCRIGRVKGAGHNVLVTDGRLIARAALGMAERFSRARDRGPVRSVLPSPSARSKNLLLRIVDDYALARSAEDAHEGWAATAPAE